MWRFNKLVNKEINISNLKINTLYLLSLILLFLYDLIMSFSNREIYDIVWKGYDTIMTLVMCISVFILLIFLLMFICLGIVIILKKYLL